MWTWLKWLFGKTTPADYELPSPKPRFTQAQADEVVRLLIPAGLLKEGSQAATVEDTGSEDPLIDKGNFVLLEPVTAGDLIVGDLATYWKDFNTVVLHRITGISGEWFTFRGDNPKIYANDPPIHKSQLKEVVRGVLY